MEWEDDVEVEEERRYLYIRTGALILEWNKGVCARAILRITTFISVVPLEISRLSQGHKKIRE